MFSGNLYIPVSTTHAIWIFCNREEALRRGFDTGPIGDSRLFAYNDESDAIAAGKQKFGGRSREGADAAQFGHKPNFAVLRMGPMAPAVLGNRYEDATDDQGRSQVVLSSEGIELLNRLLDNGSVMWNRFELTMKIITL